MKLSKSVLAGSLATAGIVLGAIAPTITAQAATSSGATAADGTVSYKAGTDVGPLGGSDSKLAIAYDETTDGKTTAVGEASAQSNANVKVQSGLLTLDSVPDFGFGNAAIGTTVALDSNNRDDSATDSQDKGVLTVTDSRTDAPGFTVDAAITNFFAGSDDKTGQPFVLNLQKTQLKNDKGGDVSADGPRYTTGINIAGAANKAGSADSTAPEASTMIDLDKGTYTDGPINASFTPTDKNTYLNLATDTPATSGKDGVQSYNATITWTLKTKSTVTA
ncbi:WxL domain-containing protein [Companilactobacillus bobalius]|uniref:WxL domain-containing protein n=2 Tax=Companilactobacillus bobalius TaxID=2801451 RepID=A0A202FCJ2_9LACO|nr:WxL domain-containing protein [Companilactobacillus bobalius]GEO58542.1 cell surface protein [Companilactobacillus paralimentarius]KAE9557521.1 hypothetical protein ATN92_15230 [Companilactobacillus bobalius]KAE9561592.1 hypothetical protein ATN92_05785 [Companilactobacillus bobalius]KAE9563668.1 hypothetical protein ATN92_02715 [Companilactobacillus bobalius]KRK82491.1 hypothetical protein FC78_GL002500 [Companilactobacillus bobalius DSM 19674]